jgi:hypothetical protein
MHHAPRALRAAGHLVFRFRAYLAPLAVLVVVASARAPDFVVDGVKSRTLTILGVVLVLSGQLIHVAVFSVVSTALVLVSHLRLTLDGLSDARQALSRAAIVWAECALVYALIRWMKKTKRLTIVPEGIAQITWQRDQLG